jgi:two-component system, sensor histidine kinase and response regulator
MQEFWEKKFRVLIVDDTEDIHDYIRSILAWRPQPKTKLEQLESELFGGKAEAVARDSVRLPMLRIDGAFQGAEAVEMVRQSVLDEDPYQLIFMDIRMPPGIDGIEAAQRIWEILPDVSILICTAYSDYSVDALLSRLGVSDRMLYVTKPFSAATLKQSTITMLKRWEVDHELKADIQSLKSLVAKQAAELRSLHRT